MLRKQGHVTSLFAKISIIFLPFSYDDSIRCDVIHLGTWPLAVTNKGTLPRFGISYFKN